MKTILWILVACLAAAVFLSIRQTILAERHLMLAEAAQRDLQAVMARLQDAERQILQAASDITREVQEASQKMASQTPPPASADPSPAEVPPAPSARPVRQPSVGTFGFRAGPRPSAEELERQREERLLRRIEQVDQAYEPFYEQLGLVNAEQQREFLMLKTRQAEAETAAIQRIVNAQHADLEARDQAIRAARERVRSELMENLRTTFGEDVAKAVQLFEASQQAAYEKLSSGQTAPTFEKK